MIYIILTIFAISYFLLVFRRFKNRNLPVWVSMLVGAILMVTTFSISPIDAFNSIDFRVISFLFGMLVITAGFEKSGLIEYIVLALLKKARKFSRLLIAVIFGSGFLSALFVNDTIAFLMTPLVLSIGSKLRIKEDKVLLMPLAFGITAGSAITPIGNPQNLLVALNSNMQRPFSEFLIYLLVPSVFSMIAIYYICWIFYRKHYGKLEEYHASRIELEPPSTAITDRKLARLSATIMVLLLVAFAVVEIFPALQDLGLSINNLALIFGIILLLLSPKRGLLLVNLSWGILIFFGGMFIVMRAVWNSGIGSIMLSVLPSPSPFNRVQSTASIMTVSVFMSQILSNVPFVQLYTFQMYSLGFNSSTVQAWLALAAGSTLAGSLSLLGAVSNVIVINSAESRGRSAFSFLEFLKVGSVVTIATSAIFFVFLAFL